MPAAHVAADDARLIRKVYRSMKARLLARLSYPWQVRIAQWREGLRIARVRKDVGADTFIDPTVQVLGWRAVRVGRSSAISEGTWLNVNQRTPGHKHIVIGDNCYIGKRNFISSAWLVHVSDYCMTGVDCRLVSGDHASDSPMTPYLISATTNDKTVRLGVNVRLGVGVTVIGNVSIGHGSIVGAGALVNRDIPPFSIAIGVPCRIHKRFDFEEKEWVAASAFDGSREGAMPDEETYLRMLRAAHPRIRMPLQASSRRFGDML